MYRLDLVCEYTPKFLIMRRENVYDNVWGDIVLNEYVDALGDVHSF